VADLESLADASRVKALDLEKLAEEAIAELRDKT
jgi:hypothetical protein